MAVYLTFDLGTTALKAGLVSDGGKLLAVHTSEYTFSSPQADWAQMPPQDYWTAAIEGARAVFQESGTSRDDLAAIGFSSQGQTYIPVDRDGRELYDAIVWVDNRSREIAEAWEKSWLSRDRFRKVTGYPWLLPGLTLFKIAWMARNALDALKAWKFLCLPDYLIYKMTGATVTDRVTAQGTGLFNFRQGCWERKFVEAAEIKEEQLPDVLAPGTVAGELTSDAAEELGLSAGVPVCVGANLSLIHI